VFILSVATATGQTADSHIDVGVAGRFSSRAVRFRAELSNGRDMCRKDTHAVFSSNDKSLSVDVNFKDYGHRFLRSNV
jgi:hypothetical protein